MKVVVFGFVFVSFLSLVFVRTGYAAELEGVKMEDSLSLAEKKLSLNGLALRKVSKFGIPIKVYVAGLYLEEKSEDGDEVISGDKSKFLEMEFVRNVEKEQITEAWSEAVFKGCIVDCDAYKGPLKEFNSLMGEMRKGQRMSLTFYPDRLEVDQKGRNPKKGSIASKSFAKNLLAIFIGPKMFSQEVKNSLLGKK
ncbi:MAG: chalcone isomerase family protein [Bdellovibrionales bacterium]|nr:chalcone isomerase family protein [Bdellovibrionales bacterium]MBK9038388.1 chalcone isomerase family protein [Bdellovibrionales bacterium]